MSHDVVVVGAGIAGLSLARGASAVAARRGAHRLIAIFAIAMVAAEAVDGEAHHGESAVSAPADTSS